MNYSLELERQGTRFLRGPARAHVLSDVGPFVDNLKNKEETCRRLCVLNPRRSDACNAKGRRREAERDERERV